MDRPSVESQWRRYWDFVSREYPRVSVPHFRQYLEQLFAEVPLEGKTVLDVGAGNGLFSYFMALRGARRVVGLEPEEAGATEGFIASCRKTAGELGLAQVTILTETIQEFDAQGERFDVLLLHNCINHLDEEACIVLHRDPGAKERFRVLFRRLHDLAAPGAPLIATDCSRHNFFGMLGMTNPLARSVEWEKHQPPETWARLLGEAGFREPRIRWRSFTRLGRFGDLVLGHKIPAFFLGSKFVLRMKA